jgi:hypothetical protein
MVHVLFDGDADNLNALIYVSVDANAKSIRVVKELCRYEYYAEYDDGFTTLERYFELPILDNITTHMFGNDWKFTCDRNNSSVNTHEGESVHDNNMIQRVEYFRKMMSIQPNGPGHVIGIYDMSSENDAATKIQAVFRGWKARKEFRFDPKTRLGKFCIEQMFQECLLSSEQT